MTIRIFVNGKPEDVEREISIEELLNLKNIRREVVTIELNDEIIERGKYDLTRLKAGDRLEVVYYIGGGILEGG
jgi:thiamine biosynthesis protein ThiS